MSEKFSAKLQRLEGTARKAEIIRGTQYSSVNRVDQLNSDIKGVQAEIAENDSRLISGDANGRVQESIEDNVLEVRRELQHKIGSMTMDRMESEADFADAEARGTLHFKRNEQDYRDMALMEATLDGKHIDLMQPVVTPEEVPFHVNTPEQH